MSRGTGSLVARPPTRASIPFSFTAVVFDGMRLEGSSHRRWLIDLYRQRFGEYIPLIRRQDVKGFVERRPICLGRPLWLEAVRNQASAMEEETRRPRQASTFPRPARSLVV